jgi:FkbM family methyltransferase
LLLFGINLLSPLHRDYGCEVHAFDPSPVTQTWIKTANVSKLPNYHFHPWGAGGFNGETNLFDYWDWDQVGIVKYPNILGEAYTDGGKGKDRVNLQGKQRQYPIPVRTLPSIMQELGHEYITILKVDVEGSEFLLLEDMFDHWKCPPIDQLTLEWHHFDLDMRYGSPRDLNLINSMLLECGHKQFQHSEPYLRQDQDTLLEFRYSLSSFCKRCHEVASSVFGL